MTEALLEFAEFDELQGARFYLLLVLGSAKSSGVRDSPSWLIAWSWKTDFTGEGVPGA